MESMKYDLYCLPIYKSMTNDETEKMDSILRKLDLILIVFLAEKGIQQRDIAKILVLSTKTIVKIFGKNYERIQVRK